MNLRFNTKNSASVVFTRLVIYLHGPPCKGDFRKTLPSADINLVNFANTLLVLLKPWKWNLKTCQVLCGLNEPSQNRIWKLEDSPGLAEPVNSKVWNLVAQSLLISLNLTKLSLGAPPLVTLIHQKGIWNLGKCYTSLAEPIKKRVWNIFTNSANIVESDKIEFEKTWQPLPWSHWSYQNGVWNLAKYSPLVC